MPPKPRSPDRLRVQCLDARLLGFVRLLPDRWKTAVVMRYGLRGYRKHSFEEIGIALGVSHQRAARIVRLAVIRLPNIMFELGYPNHTDDWLPAERPLFDSLNVRIKNILKRYGIYSFAELASKTEEELLERRGLGVTTLRQIQDTLRGWGMQPTSDSSSAAVSGDQCPFCLIPPERILRQNVAALALEASPPVTRGHILVVPRRHVSDVSELTGEERLALWALLSESLNFEVMFSLLTADELYVGFNVGATEGEAVEHAQIHVIPRYAGDASEPGEQSDDPRW